MFPKTKLPSRNQDPYFGRSFPIGCKLIKRSLKQKMTWPEVYILRSAKFYGPFLKGVFTPSLVRPKKKDYKKTGKLNATQKW